MVTGVRAFVTASCLNSLNEPLDRFGVSVAGVTGLLNVNVYTPTDLSVTASVPPKGAVLTALRSEQSAPVPGWQPSAVSVALRWLFIVVVDWITYFWPNFTGWDVVIVAEASVVLGAIVTATGVPVTAFSNTFR